MTVVVVVAIGVALIGMAGGATGAVPRASSSNQAINSGYDFNFQGGFGFDPRDSTVNTNAYLQHLVMGGLFWYNADGSLRPDLASGYTVVSPTVLEVMLRPNLTFQDGSPLTATEVKASMERSGGQTLGTAFRNEAVPATGSKRTTGTLQSIEALSPTKLRFTETVPSAGQLAALLGSTEGVIVNPKQFDDPNLKNAPIGAGPYKIVSYTPGTELKLTASDSYWDKKNVTVKNISFIQNAGQGNGPTQGLNRVTTGEFDYYNASFADTASVLATARGTVKALVTPSDTSYWWFNVCKNPFKSLTADQIAGLSDVNVRKAMNLMVDRDGLNKTIYSGKSEPRTQNWHKGSPYYDPKVAKAFSYDPKAAKAAMAKSAFPNGFTFTVVQNSNPATDRIVEYLQQQWAQLGIKMDILKSVNSADWFQLLKGPAYLGSFLGIQGIKLTSTYDATRGNNSCGYTGQQQYVDQVKATSPDARKNLVDLWKSSAGQVATDQSEVMLIWQLNQALYNSSKIKSLALVMDGLGTQWIDPTRTRLASS